LAILYALEHGIQQLQILKMHQLDPILKSLDADLEVSSTPEDATGLKKQIKEREDTLMPMYLQVS
jgi:hypothetical protein